jgi:hypothetical protein
MTRTERPGRLPARIVFFGALLALVCVAEGGHAQVTVDPETAAKVLFNEGKDLAAAGNFEKACPKFEESVKLKPGIGARFNLADCWEHVGRTASAFKLFNDVADVAKEAGQNDREKAARERAKALEPKLTKMTVKVEKPLPDIEVKRGDVIVPESSWGTPLPVDPGPTEFSAKAPGKKPWSQKVDVPASPGTLVTVTIPELTNEEPAVAVVPVAAKPAEEPKPVAKKEAAPKAKAEPDKESGPRLPTSVLLVGGAGVGAITVGIIGALEYRSKNGDAENICPSSVGCTQEQIDTHDQLVDEARTARGIAYFGFGLGAAALVGATALYLTQSPEDKPAKVQADAAIGADGSWRAVVRGTW